MIMPFDATRTRDRIAQMIQGIAGQKQGQSQALLSMTEGNRGRASNAHQSILNTLQGIGQTAKEYGAEQRGFAQEKEMAQMGYEHDFDMLLRNSKIQLNLLNESQIDELERMRLAHANDVAMAQKGQANAIEMAKIEQKYRMALEEFSQQFERAEAQLDRDAVIAQIQEQAKASGMKNADDRFLSELYNFVEGHQEWQEPGTGRVSIAAMLSGDVEEIRKQFSNHVATRFEPEVAMLLQKQFDNFINYKPGGDDDVDANRGGRDPVKYPDEAVEFPVSEEEQQALDAYNTEQTAMGFDPVTIEQYREIVLAGSGTTPVTQTPATVEPQNIRTLDDFSGEVGSNSQPAPAPKLTKEQIDAIIAQLEIPQVTSVSKPDYEGKEVGAAMDILGALQGMEEVAKGEWVALSDAERDSGTVPQAIKDLKTAQRYLFTLANAGEIPDTVYSQIQELIAKYSGGLNLGGGGRMLPGARLP